MTIIHFTTSMRQERFRKLAPHLKSLKCNAGKKRSDNITKCENDPIYSL